MTKSKTTGQLLEKSETRRNFLKKSAAAVLLAPAIMSIKTFAKSSGTLRLYCWQGYLTKDTIHAFEKATGIHVQLTTYGSNEELYLKLRATSGAGYDCVYPTLDTIATYYPENLLQPIDESRINSENIMDKFWYSDLEGRGFSNGQRYHLPFIWGTEGLTIDTDQVGHDANKRYSLRELWNPKWQGKMSLRPKSGMVGVARWMVGSDRMRAIYPKQEAMEKVLTKASRFIIKNKKQISSFWTNATEASAAFTEGNCAIGQTWDTTGILLSESTNYRYTCPSEGAFTWIDGPSITKHARNIDAVYEWINFAYKPQISAMNVNVTGYNSVLNPKIIRPYLNGRVVNSFRRVYGEQDIANLWPWPPMGIWTLKMFAKFVTQIRSA